MPRTSLGFRLVLILFATFFCGLSADTLFFYSQSAGSRTGLQERSLQEQARELLASIKVDQSGRPRINDAELEDVYRRPASGYGYTLFDGRGALRAVSRSRSDAGPLPLAQVPRSGEQFGAVFFSGPDRTAVLTIRSPQDRYFLVVSREDIEPEALAASLIAQDSTPVFALIPFVLVSLALIVAIVMLVLRPLNRASADAMAIGANSLASRLKTHGLPAEIVPLVKAFNDALDRHSRAYQLEKRLTADAAHELRTPLAVLQMRLELARGAPEVAVEWKLIDEDLANLRRLVAQLLDMARKEQGGRGEVEPVNLSRVAREAAAQVLPLAEAEGRTLEIDAPVAVMIANASKDDLRDAARNLIENALMHGRGDVRVQVRQHGDAGGGTGELAVEDDGAGISVEMMEKVFGRFFKGSETKSGAGLGLAIVRHVAHAHGGHAEVQGHGGSRVAVTLPLGGA